MRAVAFLHQLAGAGADADPGAGDGVELPLGRPGDSAPFGEFAGEFCEMVTTPWLLLQVVVDIWPASTCLAWAVISLTFTVVSFADIPLAVGPFAFGPVAAFPVTFGPAPQRSPAICDATSTLTSRRTFPLPMARLTS
jgi:hypothetical protein